MGIENQSGQPALLELRGVEFEYGEEFRLGPIDLQVPEGAFLGILGPNGSGKTTLLRLMTGRAAPQSGEVLLGRQSLRTLPPRERARSMAVISSDPHFEFPFPVQEVVSMGRFPHLGLGGNDPAQEERIIEEAMRRTEVESLRHRPISHLSSGERQRVVLARALAQQAPLLLLDEPNAHLDIRHQISIFRLLRALNRDTRLTVVIVLHDLTAAAAFCRTVILLQRGRIFQAGRPEEVITTESIREVFQADVQIRPGAEHGLPQISYPRETD